MNTPAPIRWLILACGNPLRGDDGAGPWLAVWAFDRFGGEPGVRVIVRQQWGPELAEEIARSQNVLFVDSSIKTSPGRVDLVAVEPAANAGRPTTHHLDAAKLLALSRDLYGSLPGHAALLTVGIQSVALGEELSELVRGAIPEACRRIEEVLQSQNVIDD